MSLIMILSVTGFLKLTTTMGRANKVRRVAEEADSRKRKSQEDIASDSSMEETITTNEEKVASEIKGKKLKLGSDKEPEILESDTESMIVESENESKKSDSDKDSEKMESDDKESEKSDSDKESVRSDSDKESEKSDSEKESERSNSDEESAKSGSDEESERSGSDEDSEKSGSEEESERSGIDEESERSGSDEESDNNGDSSEACSSISSSSDDSADLERMTASCAEGSENSSRMETSEEDSDSSSKEDSSEESSDNSTSIDSDVDSESSSKVDNDEDSDNSSKDNDDESESSLRVDVEVSETSSLSSSEEESESSDTSDHSIICDYMPFIEKQITEDAIVTPPELNFGYVCFGRYDNMMVEALKKCESNILLWSPNEEIPEAYFSGNIERADDIEDLLNTCDVIICYAEKADVSINFFLNKVDHDLFEGKQIINFTKSSPEDAVILYNALQKVGGDYLEARVVKHPGITDQPVHIYASGATTAFDCCAMLFKQIANMTHYCGPAPDQAPYISTICSFLNGFSFCVLSEVKKLTQSVVGQFSSQEVTEIFSNLGYESVPMEISQIVLNDETSKSAQDTYRELRSEEVTYLRFHKNTNRVLSKKGALQLSSTVCNLAQMVNEKFAKVALKKTEEEAVGDALEETKNN